LTHSTKHPQPRAVVVAGPAGAGKTTLGLALASRLGYAIVDLDTVTGPLARFALEQLGVASEDFDSPSGRRLRGLRYDALLDVARANLDLGLGVVVTAPFTSEIHDEVAWSEVRTRLRPSAALIYLDAPPDVLHERLRERGEPRDRSKLSRGPLAAAFDGAPVRDAIVLDASLPVEVQLETALQALTRPAGLPQTVLR